MSRRQRNKLLVAAGSFLTVNGAMLLIAPGRFAALREMDWLPEGFNDRVDWLGTHDRASRPLGLALAVAGVLLLVTGVARTRPVRPRR